MKDNSGMMPDRHYKPAGAYLIIAQLITYSKAMDCMVVICTERQQNEQQIKPKILLNPIQRLNIAICMIDSKIRQDAKSVGIKKKQIYEEEFDVCH